MTQAFNLSQLANNLNTSGQLDATDGLTGEVPLANLPTITVAKGGTGQNTLSANAVVLGNGTSGVQTVAPSTSGNVLTSNGTTWVSQAPSGGGVTSLNGQTGAITNTTRGAIGSYAYNGCAAGCALGNTINPADFRWRGAEGAWQSFSPAYTGSWRLVGMSYNSSGYQGVDAQSNDGLWVRVS